MGGAVSVSSDSKAVIDKHPEMKPVCGGCAVNLMEGLEADAPGQSPQGYDIVTMTDDMKLEAVPEDIAEKLFAKVKSALRRYSAKPGEKGRN